MRRTLFTFACLVPLVTFAVSGCKKDEGEPLTTAEASQALEETSIDGEATNLTSGSIEISTSFTIGQAVETAAQEIKDFVSKQLPCAKIELSGPTLSVEYGALPGTCTYKGLTYSGKHTITVTKNDMGDVVVDHEWSELSNTRVKVTGTAHVTWSFADQSRRVEHELTWTRISDGLTGTGTGDRTQTVLKGGLLEGIQIDGSRSWKSDRGQWDLGIDGVQVRWVDPVPQAGKYTLSTPQGKALTMTFTRVDEATIKVTVASGDKSFDFDVKQIAAADPS
jgi:hypothetical protein